MALGTPPQPPAVATYATLSTMISPCALAFLPGRKGIAGLGSSPFETKLE